MLKVIKMDLFRMFKSKYTYIVLAAAMLMMFASVFMTQQDISYYQQTPSALETLRETGEEVNWGIYIGQVSPEWCTGAKIGSSAYFGIYTLGRYISFASNN